MKFLELPVSPAVLFFAAPLRLFVPPQGLLMAPLGFDDLLHDVAEADQILTELKLIPAQARQIFLDPPQRSFGMHRTFREKLDGFFEVHGLSPG